ncbi:MAG: hypothetical protein ABJK43_06310 [Lentilitoribacter sp.]
MNERPVDWLNCNENVMMSRHVSHMNNPVDLPETDSGVISYV